MTQDEEWLIKEKYHGRETEEFIADSKRLQAGEPLAYVIGHIPFLNTTIYLDLPTGQAGSRPLIPRPETEYWVEKLILDITLKPTRNFRGLTPKITVLDVCAGSGCIGVAVLKALPNATVDFVEIDTRHHDTIRKNIRENDIDESRVQIMGGDLFTLVEGVYDVILANPPYIDKTLERTEASVLKYEPHNALFADDAGFALIERLIVESGEHLSPQGILVIEHEPEHVERINSLAPQYFAVHETMNDQYGIPRYTRFTRE